MNTKPLISVVIPCFNRENLISEAIESAINQDYENKEIIVVDDGSVDLSWARIERFIPLILAIRTSNRGVSAARNTGIAKASGDYIVFLDSDDKLEHGALEAYVSALKHDEKTILLGKCRIIGADGSDIDRNPYKLMGRIDGVYLDAVQVISQLAPNWGCIIPKKMILEAGGYDEALSLGEDYDLNVRLIERGAMYFPIANYTYKLRLHNDLRLSSDSSSKNYLQFFHVIENAWSKNNQMFAMHDSQLWKYIFSRWIWALGRNMYRNGEKDVGDSFIRLAGEIAGRHSWNASAFVRIMYYFIHPSTVENILQKAKRLKSVLIIQ